MKNKLLFAYVAFLFTFAVSCNREDISVEPDITTKPKDSVVIPKDTTTTPKDTFVFNSGIKPVFSDDFDGPLKTGAGYWLPYHSPGHGGNGLRRASAVTVADGMLTITAKMVDGVLVSGAVGHWDSNWKGQVYGYFEARVRAHPDPSNAMGAVILTWPDDPGMWPRDGENDFYEVPAGSRRGFTTNIHYGVFEDGKWKDKFLSGVYYEKPPTEWLTVGMDWQKDYIKVYVDDKLYWATTDKNKIPNYPHHLCIQLDAKKKSMTGSTSMDVDFVRIYQGTFSEVYPNKDPGVIIPKVVNSDFELGGTQGWTSYTNSMSVVNTNPYAGSFCGQISANGDIRQMIHGLLPNKTYTVSARVKAGNGAIAQFGADYFNGSRNVFVESTNKEYTVLEKTLTTGPSSYSTWVYLKNVGSSYVWIDNVTIW